MIKHSVGGWYRIVAIKVLSDGSRGSERLLADWFPNLITDSGMDYIGNGSSYTDQCSVGSGNATPAVTDTALQTPVASTTNKVSELDFISNTAPYRGAHIITYEFSVGSAAGNLSEVGIGRTVGALFSRALIVDGGGSPTTITVLSDEILQVTYRLEQFALTTDVTGSVTLNSIAYNYTLRAANANNGNDALLWLGYVQTTGFPNSSSVVAGAFSTQTLGTILQQPAGTIFSGATHTAGAYTPGSFERTVTYTWPIAQGNVPGGIGSILINSTRGAYQIGFDALIPKTSSDVLSFTILFSWTRHTYP